MTKRQLHQQGGTRVGVESVPKSASQARPGRTKNKANPKASTFWHQGFGVIDVCGTPIVPFVLKETAERIAQQAAHHLKRKMVVMQVGDGWGYYQAPRKD